MEGESAEVTRLRSEMIRTSDNHVDKLKARHRAMVASIRADVESLVGETRRQAEQALREVEQRLARATEAHKVAVLGRAEAVDEALALRQAFEEQGGRHRRRVASLQRLVAELRNAATHATTTAMVSSAQHQQRGGGGRFSGGRNGRSGGGGGGGVLSSPSPVHHSSPSRRGASPGRQHWQRTQQSQQPQQPQHPQQQQQQQQHDVMDSSTSLSTDDLKTLLSCLEYLNLHTAGHFAWPNGMVLPEAAAAAAAVAAAQGHGTGPGKGPHGTRNIYIIFSVAKYLH